MKTSEIKLKNSEGKDEKFHLRLTAGGQMKLREKYNESTMSLLLSAADNIDYAVDILEAALSYKNNDNSITDGEEFYDLLVENGTVGSEAFTQLFMDIATNSGILRKDQSNSVVKSVNAVYDDVFANLENKSKEMVEKPAQSTDEETPS